MKRFNKRFLFVLPLALFWTSPRGSAFMPEPGAGSRRQLLARLQSEPPLTAIESIEEDDPRAFQKKLREAQLEAIIQSRNESPKKALVKKRKQGEAASAAMDLPMQPLVKTIGGGSNVIFDAIRAGVPRWHPTSGVSDVNPSFRTEPPSMNSQGYAASIWRNARKRQPAMWRYALRTFDRMIEQQQLAKSGPKMEVTNIHYEGALTAAAKLGWSTRALEIYRQVEQKEVRIRDRLQPALRQKKIAVQITENMVLSVIRACVREAAAKKTAAPLTAALRIAAGAEESHQIPLTAIHLNPIAAAMRLLGLTHEATALLNKKLGDRIGGPEAENALDTSFNVYDVQAKDKGSYSLLVSAAVTEQDWGGAVDALKTMTEAGLYPANRHLNAWTEISERPRRRRKSLSRGGEGIAAKQSSRTSRGNGG